MHGRLALGAAVLVMVVAPRAHASPETYPLDKVKRGQTGYGMTTMSGTKPERFTFEVVSVVHNFLPKQDIILVKSDDPKLAVTGFWQGMSGSPLYI
ncbi:MAG: SpoIVB peptidase S55 domain-containing protein, partial [Thermoanaerobaculia bacterium]